MEKRELQLEYQAFKKLEELDERDCKLIESAIEAKSQAYAPYSDFKVGCAILLDNGKTITGSNQENASYPVGHCAEVTALSAVSSQFPKAKIDSMAIVGSNLGNMHADVPVAPCGKCRQQIAEYEKRMAKQFRILLYTEDAEIYLFEGIEQLLPFAFFLA